MGKQQASGPAFLIYAGIIHAIGLALLLPMLVTLPGPGSEVALEPAAIDVEIIPAVPLAGKIEPHGEQTSALPSSPGEEDGSPGIEPEQDAEAAASTAPETLPEDGAQEALPEEDAEPEAPPEDAAPEALPGDGAPEAEPETPSEDAAPEAEPEKADAAEPQKAEPGAEKAESEKADAAEPQKAEPGPEKAELEKASPEPAKPVKASKAKRGKKAVAARKTSKPHIRRAARKDTKIAPFNGALSGLFSPGAPAKRR